MHLKFGDVCHLDLVDSEHHHEANKFVVVEHAYVQSCTVRRVSGELVDVAYDRLTKLDPTDSTITLECFTAQGVAMLRHLQGPAYQVDDQEKIKLLEHMVLAVQYYKRMNR